MKAADVSKHVGDLRARIDGGFWLSWQTLVRKRVIPYQWRAMNDEIAGAPPSHSVENLRVAAGQSSEAYEGMVFQDSDLYKWLEAAGQVMIDDPDALGDGRSWIRDAVDLISAAQRDDGYLNSYFIVNGLDKRWTNLRDAHELYCAGHLIEAAVALSRSGSESSGKLLEVARKFADLIGHIFGPREGQTRGYPGHEEIELALIRLFRVTGERRYLDLAEYFIRERGRTPNYFEVQSSRRDFQRVFHARPLEYYQAHQPATEQTSAVGHAVRAMYLYIAMADLALEKNDREMRQQCESLWEDVTGRKMYVTGSIGASSVNEAFGAAYDLPNDTAYAETCAAIGLFLFSSRMARLTDNSRYADVMERCLFNGILSGLSLDGESYFYVNPLDVSPAICDENPTYEFVKYRRQRWYGCACCPPNVARTVAGLGDHAYHRNDDTIFADLFHTGSVEFAIGDRSVTLKQSTDYPWSGNVAFEIASDDAAVFSLAVRVPGWASSASVQVNGQASESDMTESGYVAVEREWRPGDTLLLQLPMQPERLRADSRVKMNVGKVAVGYGPLIYCLEEVDNGPALHLLRLPRGSSLSAEQRPNLLGGTVVIEAEGVEESATNGNDSALYTKSNAPVSDGPRKLLFIPYHLWANRRQGEMTVWIRE